MDIHWISRSFQIRKNSETLITEHRLIFFWLPFTERLKIFGSVSKHGFWHIENFYYEEEYTSKNYEMFFAYLPIHKMLV